MTLVILITYVIGCLVAYQLMKNYFGESMPTAEKDALMVFATFGSWLTFIVFLVNFYLTKNKDDY